LCAGSCKVTLLNVDELTGDKITEWRILSYVLCLYLIFIGKHPLKYKTSVKHSLKS
jgi:hypothetical protein